ncbi:MAG: extracellular solute-binding protein [Treponemataceae bacterium]
MAKRNPAMVVAFMLSASLAFSGGSAQQSAGGAAKTGEPLNISVLASIWPPYEQTKTIFPEIEKATNTKLTIEWAPRDGYRDKISTILASGKLPDVIIITNPLDKEFLKNQGAIIPLNDLLNKYAPNYLSKLKKEDYPFVRDISDGNMYFMSLLIDFPPSLSTMVRQDWLDRCGLQAPKTWDDWLNMLRAFRDQDANGDGDKTNEIPYSGNIRHLQLAFGIKSESLFVIDDNGNYLSVFEHPAYIDFLTAMTGMYKEGLLDKEYVTRGLISKLTDLFVIMDNGTLGSTVTFAERARLSTEVLRQKNPKATWTCVTPITGPKGVQLIPARSKFGGTMAVITVAGEKKAKQIVQVLDFFFGGAGEKLINYGVEGVHHKLVDGKPVLQSPYIDGFVEARKAGLIFQPFPFNWLKDNYMQILTNGKTYDQLTDTKKIFYRGLFLNEGYFNITPPTLSTEAYGKNGIEIMSKLEELEAGVIFGRLSIDEFKARLAKIKTDGLDAITKQGAEAWKRLNK